MAALKGSDFEKLKELASRTYKEQAIWFLNAFWHKLGEKEAERLWLFTQKVQSLDLQKGAQGNELDEVNAHRFLEYFKETMTVTEMRENLRSTGAISGNIRYVPLVHVLIFRYRIDWKELVNAPQGDNRAEIEEAQRRLDAVQAAFKAAEARAAEAKAALNESKQREREAQQAQQELEAALAELKAQEDAFNNKTKELTARSEDPNTGLVTRNKAKAELAQHLSSDPLPLRRAKITQEAAVKKAEKATQAAADARAAAEAARVAAERALEDMQRKVEEAEAYLQEVKSKPGSAQGQIWWMERELQEARAYLPERKGGLKKQPSALAP